MSDNFPLSDRANDASGTQDETDAAVASYLLAARAPNTHRAYAFDLADFEAWGGSIPASPDGVARYLASRAGQLRPSTLKRRVAALASAHRDRGYADPTKAVLVRRVIQGIERRHGTAPQQVRPLLIDDLAGIVTRMGNSRVEIRDKAILLVGFFGALRRSEIVALDQSDVVPVAGGLSLNIRRSKTDRRGEGRKIFLAGRDDPLCPARAVEAWCKVSASREAALFTVTESGGMRLSTKAVARIVKRYATLIGLDCTTYSGHSLRAGFVTSAVRQGFDAIAISKQTRHRSQQALSAYCRTEETIQLSAARTRFPDDKNFRSLFKEQYALLRGVETSHEWNVADQFGDALIHAVGEPVTYVQASSDAKGHRDRLVRFSNSPITRASKAILRGRTSGNGLGDVRHD